jgi:hypothetical protein
MADPPVAPNAVRAGGCLLAQGLDEKRRRRFLEKCGLSRKIGWRLSSRQNAERVCAEIMLKPEAMAIQPDPIAF